MSWERNVVEAEDVQLHVLIEVLRIIKQPAKKFVRGFKLLGPELSNSSWFKVLVEECSGVFPPFVVWREAKGPAESHSSDVSDHHRKQVRLHSQLAKHGHSRP